MAKEKKFDAVILGAGLTGLLVAAELSRRGQRVALVDRYDRAGGDDRAHQTQWGPIDRSLSFIPASETAEHALQFMQNYLPELRWQRAEIPPLTFESGELKPFVGFGEKKLPATDELLHFTASERLLLDQPLHQVIEKICAQIQGEIYLRSFVTEMLAGESQITAVVLNGKDTLVADQFYFCEPIHELLKTSIHTQIAPRGRQKIAKAQFWTAISVQLFHPQPITANDGLHVLWSPSEDEPACVGWFPPQSNEQFSSRSQWLTYVPFDATEDDEATGAAVRRIKKQIKRAYPNAFEKLLGEIILVAPGVHGYVDAKPEGLTPFANLFIAYHQLEPLNPLLGAIAQAEKAIGGLAPLPTPGNYATHLAQL